MRKPSPLIATAIPFSLIALAGLSACCGPAKCIQARGGTAILDTTISQIEKYKERNGRYPVILDHISKGYEDHMRWDFKAACRDCTLPEYRTDSFGYELEFSYESYGKVRCLHNNENEHWSCKGVY